MKKYQYEVLEAADLPSLFLKVNGYATDGWELYKIQDMGLFFTKLTAVMVREVSNVPAIASVV